tara:strand:- start:733 stop:921 length:189 start_codon:yes stop_codon:yes gene_type:complete
MSREHWEETQIEDLYNRYKEEGYTDKQAENLSLTTFYEREKIKKEYIDAELKKLKGGINEKK